MYKDDIRQVYEIAAEVCKQNQETLRTALEDFHRRLALLEKKVSEISETAAEKEKPKYRSKSNSLD